MADVIDKKAALRRYFPRPFYQLQEVGGDGLEIVLDAVGDELNTAATEIANARQQFLLAYAEGTYLDTHGINVDILRPRGFNMSDDDFRQLIRIVTNSPKNTSQIFERLIDLFFGPSARANGLVDAYSYRKNEIILEVASGALSLVSNRSLLGTTFIHPDENDSYTALPQAIWSTTLAASIGATDTTATITSTVGVPLFGVISIGAVPLRKLFTRVGSVLTFKSQVGDSFSSGTAVTGPQTPGNYPSGYCYRRARSLDFTAPVSAGATVAQVGAFPEDFPAHGVVYMGDPAGLDFEAKGYTVATSPNRLLFDGPTTYAHNVGEFATSPAMLRQIKTTLAQTITAGTSLGGPGELTVASSAAFPLTRQAIRLDNGGDNAEMVPFISRKVGDPTKILIDPDYVFEKSHASGERLNLIARQTAPRISGYDYAFFLDDTSSVLNALLSFLRRVKVTGCKLVLLLK